MKTCFKCGRCLPPDQFYPHPAMADGRLGKCKECTRNDVREHRQRTLEKRREYDRERYTQDPARRRYCLDSKRRRAPEKHRALVAVHNALRDRRLVRQPCEVCGAKRADAHHPDYARPLDVRWLCRLHHMRLHGEERTKSA